MAARRRILCLHGRGLNGAFFKAQLGRLPKLLPADVELHFMDGPYATKATFAHISCSLELHVVLKDSRINVDNKN
eukprot:3556989-Amphidinium_carterae.1